ncbi:MAG TPA: metalloregulator ArsR/SmtB family transcription factor [Acidimicrobiia bacterium]|nr:metalloregulator ArsR/SmtB family transcription factor [Acidimicrobiia bacterium]
MGSRADKEALFEALASVGKALASGRRAEIVDLLAQGERSVEDIAAELEQSVANTSHHLRNLARSGLVRTRREGTRIFYGLASEQVTQLWTVLRGVAAAHVAEVDRLARAYLGDGDGLQPISRDELARRLRTGEVTVIDVRPAPEYEAGHVQGARSVPIRDLERRLDGVAHGSQLVAYCRGPYCVFADDAVRLLRGHGFEARRLEDGFPEWKRAGLPVAVGAAPGGESS